MFNTLQSRLWFTYIFLISMMLCIIGGSIFLVVYRGNVPLLQASSALQTLRLAALPRLNSAKNLEPETLQKMLTSNTASLLQGRIVILTTEGEVIADSSDDPAADLPDFEGLPQVTEIGELPILYRDSEGRAWYYIIDTLNDDLLVFFAVNRPRLQIVAIFRDQYLGPLMRTGLIALLVAFIFSILMSRWISAPLRRISREARQVADGQAHPIPPEPASRRRGGHDEIKPRASPPAWRPCRSCRTCPVPTWRSHCGAPRRDRRRSAGCAPPHTLRRAGSRR